MLLNRYVPPLLVAYTLVLSTGCVSTAQRTYYKPSKPPENGHITSTDCLSFGDSVQLIAESGVTISLSAGIGVVDRREGYSVSNGVSIGIDIVVPTGVIVRMLSPSATITTGSGAVLSGDLHSFRRVIWYGPKKGSGRSLATQTLSPDAQLIGWSPSDAKSSGLVPPNSYVDFMQNSFSSYATFIGLSAPSFTLALPDLSIGDKRVSIQRVSFTLVKNEKSWGVCP